MNVLLVLLLAQVLSPRALYIAPRLDGSSGAGTVTDPFNGSTPSKLMKAWQKTAYRTDGGSQQLIVFQPGFYTLTNELRLPADSTNVMISGYGATIVYAEKNLAGQRTMLSTAWSGNAGTVIEGFTLDCGSEVTLSATNSKVCGVYLGGRNSIARNLTIRNILSFNGPAVDQEAFGIITQGDGVICSGCVITGTRGASNQVDTGISINGDDCLLTGCVVDLGDFDPTNSLTSFGYSLYGNRNTMSANVAKGVDAAISMDGSGSGGSNVWSDNIVIGNQLSGNEMAVRIQNNSQSYTNWNWVANNFRGMGRSWLSIWTDTAWQATTKLSGHSFIGDLFTGTVRSNANITLSNFEGPHTFIGNRFSAQPDINYWTNAPDILGTGNIVRGRNTEHTAPW